MALICSTAFGRAADSVAAVKPRLAGTVEFASGNSMITPQVGDSRLVAKGSEVHEGDTIVTFRNGEAQLQMLDGAYLMLRQNSRMTIEAYVADGGDKDRSILDLIKGTVRSITGWIGKYNRAAYEIRTPIFVAMNGPRANGPRMGRRRARGLFAARLSERCVNAAESAANDPRNAHGQWSVAGGDSRTTAVRAPRTRASGCRRR
jgi:hypothetical protein